MPHYFLIASGINIFILFFLDIVLNKRLHRIYLRHFVFSILAIVLLTTFFMMVPQYNQMLAWERNGGLLNSILSIIGGLLLFDAFVYVMHRYVEHGILWRWHKYHHTLKNNNDLTYYSASMVGLEESAYYLFIQLGASVLFGMGLIETLVFVTWVMQQGAYVHQKGLPKLPWPLLSACHHRTHHFKPSRYYGGLFLFWDRLNSNHDIDDRALNGTGL
ncbi:sterol desaturase family protein [Legionella bononiensis]|uniref:Sterol desaturase family protein n=1 Tax=Legionella bononiensis TaxID=2793102 RepID=A0ABS1WDY4_9GAMM|nr:sterol desaturase family protein [Legionella bononiensis]MBL7479564.1 sterol desaturase family protein [Legionella bononiensis]MBL7527562.1 sterol desaturase family protein [Legionella bononiensis]